MILDDKLNAKDKQRNDFRPMTSSKKASKHQSAPPTPTPLIHSLENDSSKSHIEEHNCNHQRPASMPVTYSPVTQISQEVPRRLTTKSVPSLVLIRDIVITPAPSTPTLKKLQFSSTILEHETWTREDYDRRGDQTTCNSLTPSLAQKIKQELNQFKMVEMQVHEESKKNTHFFA
ncbi:4840_t:CDS:2 [Diversispora eburnea]|uniref:4840_t:CDS:1 n=1 Tax=Diversispora eburnea TaxID=1213867 RepID=A0A9N9FQU6_9GLOM|nr:4840_t:CDS:2 [Diversispora eburnea]